MAPVTMLIPLLAIYVSIKRYGLMNPGTVDPDALVLNEAVRSKVYYYLAVTFIAGGFLNFISQYLICKNTDLFSAMAFSFFLITIGVIIKFFERRKLSDNIKDTFTIIIICSVIPVITLRFIDVAGVTVWAFPFILIVFALLFNRPAALAALTVTTVITQILVWIITPSVDVIINQADYIARIGILGITVWIAFYVNRLFIHRLKENAAQIRCQKLISDIFSDFVMVNKANIDEKIGYLLKLSGKFFDVDRAFVVFYRDKNTNGNYYEWCGSEDIKSKNATMGMKGFPSLIMLFWKNRIVNIPDIQKMAEREEAVKQALLRRGSLSFLAVPIELGGSMRGFLGFESVGTVKSWWDDHINFLRIISNLLADALTKVHTEEEINFMAYYDHLTHLPNRSLFKDRASQAIYAAQREGKQVAIVFLDLDSFKTVNDTMGHEGGDALLSIVSKKLSACVRKYDTVSRFGGDEFLVMLNNVSSEKDIFETADGIMKIFGQPFILNEQEFFITASAGIAVYPTDGEDTETLIKHADIAMYKAKDMGKNRYVLCSPEMKDEVVRKLHLTNSLYHAKERGELLLHYQPQVCLVSKEIIGLEALLRWNNPEKGFIPPSVFIPLAEQTGLINPIGQWVTETACRQNKRWQDLGLPHIRMAVNVSVHQFRNPGLVTQISSILEETGLRPEYLELEITESVATNETGYIIGILSKLKEIGVTISIDDFGTEYSSLSRLKKLPIDRIKMDMQFVRGIDGDDKDRAITKIIINLAKNLGLKVIAEGVETRKQLDFLSQKMCDEVQGYYYYKPMPADAVEAILMESTAGH